ncbi:MAG: glycosyltransferase, partial [Rudaea sp.]|nr:glycosyltransferase [Rudaea sp.]
METRSRASIMANSVRAKTNHCGNSRSADSRKTLMQGEPRMSAAFQADTMPVFTELYRDRRALRIVHILNHTGRLNGNVHAAIDVACAQAALGHQVAVASGGGDFDATLAQAGVETVKIDHHIGPGLPGNALRFARFCKNWAPDVIHAHMIAAALIARPTAYWLRVPLISTVHNEFQKNIMLMGIADRVIAVSKRTGASLLRRGLSQDRLRVVLNGTIGSARQPQPGPAPAPLLHPSIVCVAGLHPRKGIDRLLHAMRAVRNVDQRPHLYLVGEGPMQAEYEALTKTLDLEDCVTFTGPLDDPRSHMAAADIFVLASLADPAPLVISEARQAGCAIIASDVDGIPEMLDHGASGVLVPPGSAEALAKELLNLLQDDDLRAKYRRNAGTGIDRFSVARVAKET